MRRIIGLIILVSLIGCSDKADVKTSSGVNVDSLIKKSEKNFVIVNEANKKSDTAITTKIDKTVEKIGQLENEIKELKEENNELKDKLDAANDGGKPYRIRTISNN
jgi:peptidoglycan hydrolase CwlO-like protein